MVKNRQRTTAEKRRKKEEGRKKEERRKEDGTSMEAPGFSVLAPNADASSAGVREQAGSHAEQNPLRRLFPGRRRCPYNPLHAVPKTFIVSPKMIPLELLSKPPTSKWERFLQGRIAREGARGPHVENNPFRTALLQPSLTGTDEREDSEDSVDDSGVLQQGSLDGPHALQEGLLEGSGGRGEKEKQCAVVPNGGSGGAGEWVNLEDPSEDEEEGDAVVSGPKNALSDGAGGGQRQPPDRDQPMTTPLLAVFVDAANVAHAGSSAHVGKLVDWRYLIEAHDAVSDWARRSSPASTTEITFVVRQVALANNLAGTPVADELCRRDPNGTPFLQAPARSDDDEWLLLLARDKEEECGRGTVKIVSNDNFDEYVEGVGSRGMEGVTPAFLDRVRWKFAAARGGAIKLAPAGVPGARR